MKRWGIVLGSLASMWASPCFGEPPKSDHEGVVSGLCAADPAVRLQTVAKIPGYPAGARAAHVLRETLLDEDEAVRRAVRERLASFREPAFLEAVSLFDEVVAKSPRDREALDVLASLGSAVHPIDIAHVFVDEGAPFAGLFAAAVSADTSSADSMRVLSGWAFDGSTGDVRRAAAVAMALLADVPSSAPAGPEAGRAESGLVARLKTPLGEREGSGLPEFGSGGGVRRLALTLLARSPRVDPASVEALAATAEGDWSARGLLAYWARTSERALEALARLEPEPFLSEELAPTPGGRRLLRIWLESGDADVRRRAAIALSENASAEDPVWPVLQGFLAQTQSPFVVQSSLTALARAGPRAASAKPALETLWARTRSSEGRHLRPWTAWALRRVGDPRAELTSASIDGLRDVLRGYAYGEQVSPDDFLHAIVTHPPSAREFLVELWRPLVVEPRGEWASEPCVRLFESLLEGDPIGEAQAADVARRLSREASAIRARLAQWPKAGGALSERLALLLEEGGAYEDVFNPLLARACVRVLAESARPRVEVAAALDAYDGIADDVGRILLARARRRIDGRGAEGAPAVR